ncbi:hypothetical protein AB0I10_39725 [Streptomyces sp. NPDC050636]|uniref:hypothetical protein n=1 Tax=Streptomyces sp. NPDC050636 TaxID=3154510 RepID=UPI003439A953
MSRIMDHSQFSPYRLLDQPTRTPANCAPCWQPQPPGHLSTRAVSTAVNNVRNNGPHLLDEIADDHADT